MGDIDTITKLSREIDEWRDLCDDYKSICDASHRNFDRVARLMPIGLLAGFAGGVMLGDLASRTTAAWVCGVTLSVAMGLVIRFWRKE